jgi:RNA-binding protein
MPTLPLTTAERRALRADAHHLDPVVVVGNDGLTDAVIQEADRALKAHGLIKVRVFSDTRDARQAMLAALSERLNAAEVQHIGKLLVLWRPVPPKEKVEREDSMPGPRTVKLVSFSKSGNHRATVKKVKLFGNQRVAAGGAIKRTTLRQVSAKKKAQA